MIPTSKMLSSTNSNDTMCDATFNIGSNETTIRMESANYFKVAQLIDFAYRVGKEDGARQLANDVHWVIKNYR